MFAEPEGIKERKEREQDADGSWDFSHQIFSTFYWAQAQEELLSVKKAKYVFLLSYQLKVFGRDLLEALKMTQASPSFSKYFST